MDIQRIRDLAILLVVQAVVLTLFLNVTTLLIWDEPVYLSNARSHLLPTHFTEDFRFPLLEYIIAGVWSITGISTTAAQYLMIVFSLLLTTSIYLLGTIYISHRRALLLSGLVAFCWQFLFWGFRVYTDVPAVASIMFATYFLLKKRPVLAGVLTTVAFLFRFPVILVIVPFLFVFFRELDSRGDRHTQRRQQGKRLIDVHKCIEWSQAGRYIFGAVIVLLPWLIYNTIRYSNPLWDLFAQAQVIVTYTTWQSPLLLLTQIGTIIGLGGLLVAGLFLRRPNRLQAMLYASTILQLIFYLGVVRLKLTRYLLVLLPLLFLLLLIGESQLRQQIRIRPKGVRTAYNVILTLTLLILCWSVAWNSINEYKEYQVQLACERDGAYVQTLTYLKEQYPPGTRIMSNDWTSIAYAGNFWVISTWNDNLTLVDEVPQVDVAVRFYPYGLPIDLAAYERAGFVLQASFTDECDDTGHVFQVR